MGNLLGEPFKDYVNDQIRARQTVHGKTSRTTEEISYLNSKNAWIKLASGTYMEQGRLDLLNKNGNPMLDGVTPGSDLAIKNVLFNGLTSFKGKNHNRSQRAGIGTNGAYGVGGTSQHGFSPMPGILDADIKDLNRGSIKKASINIKAHNRNQFDVIDALYLRLGFSIMLEWGVDKYLEGLDSNGNGNVKNMGTTLTDKKFFDWSESSYNTVLPAIEKMREKYNGNYDGMFGVISNFSWTFEADGTYNIKLDIISQGDIIESLKANLPPHDQSTQSAYQTSRISKISEQGASNIDDLYKTLYPGLGDIIDKWWNQRDHEFDITVMGYESNGHPQGNTLRPDLQFSDLNFKTYNNDDDNNVANIKSNIPPLSKFDENGTLIVQEYTKTRYPTFLDLVYGSFDNIVRDMWDSKYEEAVNTNFFTLNYPNKSTKVTIPFPTTGPGYESQKFGEAVGQDGFLGNTVKLVYDKNGQLDEDAEDDDYEEIGATSYLNAQRLIFDNLELIDFKNEILKLMREHNIAGGPEDPQFKKEKIKTAGKTEEEIEEEKEKINYEKGLNENKGKNKVLAYFYKIKNSTINLSNPPTITALGQAIGIIIPDGEFVITPPPPPTIEEIKEFEANNPTNIVSSPRRNGLNLGEGFGKFDIDLDIINFK